MNIHQQTQIISLGVNIDHVIALRNLGMSSDPDPWQAAMQAEEAGADCITLSLLEDRRGMQDTGIEQLSPRLLTCLNLKVAVSDELLDAACRIKPQKVSLVPALRDEWKPEDALDVTNNFSKVQASVRRLHDAGIKVSLLIDADVQQIQASAEAGADLIQINASRYAHAQTPALQAQELERLQKAAIAGIRHGLPVHAGHGLHYRNTAAVAAIAEISELHIGHAVVAQAMSVGWQKAVSDMKALMVKARLQARI